MRVAFISRGSVRAFDELWQREGGIGKGRECGGLLHRCLGTDGADCADVNLFLFGFEGSRYEVSYEKELKGESFFFEDVAAFSKRTDGVVVSGCITDSHGIKRRSAVVAEKGKILGVTDSLYAVDERLSCGAALKLYDTSAGKMGVAVAEDFYFPEALKALSLCGCDFIVCPFGATERELQTVLLRAHAFFCGVPILFSGIGYAMAAEPSGRLALDSSQSPVAATVENRREYHLVERRTRMVMPRQ